MKVDLSCLMWEGDSELEDILLIIFNSISFFSVSMVLLHYHCNLNSRNFAFKLVVCLQTADMFLCISNLLIIFEEVGEKYCEVAGWLITGSCNASVLWTLILAYSIYQNSVLEKPTDEVQKKEKIFFIVGYILPYLYTLIPLSYGGYGQSGYWCSFTFDKNNFAKTVLTFMFFQYGLVWCSMIIMIFVYGSVIYKIFKKHRNLQEHSYFASRLFLFPIVFCLCWLFQSINRIDNFLHPNDKKLILACLQIGGSGLIGFFNMICYAISNLDGLCFNFHRSQHSDGVSSDGIIDNLALMP